MTYTQLKIKATYRDKLAKLASSQNRSMANMVEVLIDVAVIDLVSPGSKPPSGTKTPPSEAQSEEA